MARAKSTSIDDFTQIILDSITDGVFTIDRDWRITSFNKAAEHITGIYKSEAIGQHCSDIFRANICETDCALKYTMETGKPILRKTIYIVTTEGEQVPVSISTALLRNERGEIIGGVESFRDLSVVEELRKELQERYSFSDIISKNSELQRIFDILPQIAESDSTVLIEGESGTGKELFARVIHHLSGRRQKKLVAINCSAIPDTLLESELFGYKAGAFTDAKKDKKGRFAQAEGGTIFLDEIGDISQALQARLLRVLQEKEYEPLGSTHPETANVRVLAATNKNLSELVERGTFRQDLFYRINVIKISIPPLRERREDIPHLMRHFVAKVNRLQDKNIADVSPEVLRILMAHTFPGNVRELENIIEHAFVLCKRSIIEKEHLPQEFHGSGESAATSTSYATSLNELEANFILDVLKRNNWNRLATAKELGIHKTTLFRKIKRLGIELPDRDGRSSRATGAT